MVPKDSTQYRKKHRASRDPHTFPMTMTTVAHLYNLLSLSPEPGSGDYIGDPSQGPVALRPPTRAHRSPRPRYPQPNSTTFPCSLLSQSSEIHLDRFRHLPHSLLLHL